MQFIGQILLCLVKGLKQKRLKRKERKERNVELKLLQKKCENCGLKNVPDKLQVVKIIGDF